MQQQNFLQAHSNGGTQTLVKQWDFAASNVVKTSVDNRPYNMRVLYLIAY